MAIRSASSTDEAEVVALWHACGLTISYNDPASDFRFARAKSASDVLVGLEGEGRVVGTVMVGHDGHRGWLYYVAVAPDRRRTGIGRKMVEAAEAWLRAHRVAKTHLMIRETNQAVASFYEQLGYECVPRVLMSKWLDPS